MNQYWIIIIIIIKTFLEMKKGGTQAVEQKNNKINDNTQGLTPER